MSQLKKYLLLAAMSGLALNAQTPKKALVGGTLIDGYGGPPIRNSVILIDANGYKPWGRWVRSRFHAAPKSS